MPISREDLKGKKVEETRNNINVQFIEWVNKVRRLNPNRALEVCTLLLNNVICQNYFPTFDILTKDFPFIVPEILTKEKIREFRIHLEKIYSLFIMIVLRSIQSDTLNQDDTDKEIDRLYSEGILIQSFFLMNSLPKNGDLGELIDYIGESVVPDRFLPQLDFDPEFKILLDHEAIKELYDTSFITDWLESKPPQKQKYQVNKSVSKTLLELRDRPYQKVFEIDGNLGISKFDSKLLVYMGNLFFSNFNQINDIITLFNDYYSIRVSNKALEISNILKGFKSLFKVVDGKSYVKIRMSKLKTLLRRDLYKDFVNTFIKRFIYIRSNEQISLKNESKSVRSFFNHYHNFLCSAAFNYSGIVYMGIFNIWRAMIKYFEGLQRQEEFLSFKGALLENWCYEKAIEIGFNANKIILRNPKVEPSDNYRKMIEQIESFPKDPYVIECEFYGDYSKGSFFEIDLAIRVQKYLFIFECKSYLTQFSEVARYVQWMDKFHENMHSLIIKGKHIIENIREDKLEHEFLDGAEKFIPIIIQTEGLFPSYGIIQFNYFERFLKELKKNVNSCSIDEFLRQPLL